MDRLEMLDAVKHSPDALGLIEALKRLPEDVEAEIAGLPEATLRARPAEGEWCIREVVGHLRDAAELWTKRLFMVFSQFDPILPVFQQEESVEAAGYQDADLGPVLAAMREQRMKTCELLEHAPDWSRIGQHPLQGRKSLRQFAEIALQHDRIHLQQIRTLKSGTAAKA